MKIGIIGERYNLISFSMLCESLKCNDIEIIWFVDSRISKDKRDKLYGQSFDCGIIANSLLKSYEFIKDFFNGEAHDCKKICRSKDIPYIMPVNKSINSGLPESMYMNPQADYVLVAGCDQILKGKGLRIVKNKIINYHYSPLPAYRGKYVVFWQWYNREPYIGYSFHEVDEGVDTGEIIFQGKVNYDPNDNLSMIDKRVIATSSSNICRVFDGLANNSKVLLDGKKESSYYPSKKYLDLVTANRSKTVNEMLSVFEMLSYFKLENGLIIDKIISTGKQPKANYHVDTEGIIIPLSDGYIKGTVNSNILFWLCGRKRILKGLN